MKINKMAQKTLFHLTWVLFFLIHFSEYVHAKALDESRALTADIKTSETSIEEKVDLEIPKEPTLIVDRPYYQKWEEGWFWYLDPKPAKKKKEEKPKASPRTEPKDFKSKWPEFKTADDIHAYEKILLGAAVMDPTPEKVQQYLEFQKYIMSKSRLFTDVAQRVIWENPELDQSAKKPRADYAREVVYQQSKEEISRKMAQIARKGGIFFIFSSTCPYCHLEAPILKQFETAYGVKIIPVSIDGGGLPEYPRPILDNGIASALEVNVTPTLFFGVPPKEMHRIANGFVAFDELRDRVISIVESGGEFQ